ncbi:type II secretion system protein [Marinomonas agarivorans]|nr:type II secretion system protein [Marinomonas agarivorans]
MITETNSSRLYSFTTNTFRASKSTLFAFTLLELMVVIAIISILASFAAPKLTRHISKANLVQVHSVINQSQAAIEEYLLIYSRFPTNTELVQWNKPPATSHHIKSVHIVNNKDTTGTLKITLNKNIGFDIEHHFLLTRDDKGSWDCSSSLPHDYLPRHCLSTANSN